MSRTTTQRAEPIWEFRTVTIARSVSRSEYRRALTEQAERGQWELRRVVVLRDGTRRVTLRRRMPRVTLSRDAVAS